MTRRPIKTKQMRKRVTQQLIGKLGELQERLYANGSRVLLIVLQGMDTSGKDEPSKRDVRETIRKDAKW